MVETLGKAMGGMMLFDKKILMNDSLVTDLIGQLWKWINNKQTRKTRWHCLVEEGLQCNNWGVFSFYLEDWVA